MVLQEKRYLLKTYQQSCAIIIAQHPLAVCDRTCSAQVSMLKLLSIDILHSLGCIVQRTLCAMLGVFSVKPDYVARTLSHCGLGHLAPLCHTIVLCGIAIDCQ